MGCNTSKLDDEEAVKMCKDRKKFIKQALEHRTKFATSHIAYVLSLERVSAALREYIEGDKPREFSLDSFIPPYTPVKKANPKFITIAPKGLSAPSLQSKEHSTVKINYYRPSGTPSVFVEERPRSPDTYRVQSYSTMPQYGFDGFPAMDSPQMNSSYYTNAPQSRPNLPPPSPPQNSQWDFFWNPFSSLDYYGYGYPTRTSIEHQSVVDDDPDGLRQVREEEGIPDLEEESEHEKIEVGNYRRENHRTEDRAQINMRENHRMGQRDQLNRREEQSQTNIHDPRGNHRMDTRVNRRMEQIANVNVEEKHRMEQRAQTNIHDPRENHRMEDRYQTNMRENRRMEQRAHINTEERHRMEQRAQTNIHDPRENPRMEGRYQTNMRENRRMEQGAHINMEERQRMEQSAQTNMWQSHGMEQEAQINMRENRRVEQRAQPNMEERQRMEQSAQTNMWQNHGMEQEAQINMRENRRMEQRAQPNMEERRRMEQSAQTNMWQNHGMEQEAQINMRENRRMEQRAHPNMRENHRVQNHRMEQRGQTNMMGNPRVQNHGMEERDQINMMQNHGREDRAQPDMREEVTVEDVDEDDDEEEETDCEDVHQNVRNKVHGHGNETAKLSKVPKSRQLEVNRHETMISQRERKEEEAPGFTVYANKRPTSMDEVIKDLESQFVIVCNAAKEVSAMLEANRAQCLANLSNGVTASKILNPVALLRSGSSRSSSSRFMLCTSGGSREGSESSSDLSDDSSMFSKSHHSTLDRLYAWEKRLYEEVRSGERVRLAYEKKCAQLRNHDVKGDDPTTVDKTRIALRDLHTRIKVSIHSIESISRRIETLRDQELHPQLLELVQGLARMWKVMAECHQMQKHTLDEAKLLLAGASTMLNRSKRHQPVFSTSDPHQLARLTSNLEAELRNWRACFASWITSQQSYVHALSSWLLRCMRYEPNTSKLPFSPRRSAGVHPIFGICIQWTRLLDTVGEGPVLDGMDFFAAGMGSIYAQQLAAQIHRSEYRRFEDPGTGMEVIEVGKEVEEVMTPEKMAEMAVRVLCAGMSVAMSSLTEFAISSAQGYAELVNQWENVKWPPSSSIEGV